MAMENVFQPAGVVMAPQTVLMAMTKPAPLLPVQVMNLGVTILSVSTINGGVMEIMTVMITAMRKVVVSIMPNSKRFVKH